MPAPGLSVIWDDQSQIASATVPTEDGVDRPIFMTVVSSDKGPEEWKTKVYGQDFYDYYGATPSFYKHGQSLIQAANIIDAGGYLTIKRVVAQDATLANIGVVAEVTNVPQQKIDPVTKKGLWIDNVTNKPTTVPQYNATGALDPNAMIMENHINIQFKLKTVALSGNDIKSFANTFLAANKHTNPAGTNGQYPLFMILDNGRGVSKKRWRIYRDTTVSSPVKYVRYFLEIMEDGEVLEQIPFTMNPDIVEKERNMSLSNSVMIHSKQLRAVFFDEEFKAFAENVSMLMGFSDDEYAYADCLFGTNFYGINYSNVTISSAPNLGTIYGIELANGSNGSFGDRPITAATWPIEIKKAFDGSFDDCIYDLDNNRIDAIFDANYPDVVKRSIEQLVNFREDCMFFRDMGTGIRGLDDIKLEYDKGIARSRFCASYINSYDIYEKYTKKQITVTIMYNLARLFVKHFINGRNRPFCGQKYDVIIPTDSLIEGTLNFSPKHTPALDQRKELDTLRANYCSYYDGNILTLNSEYTSQVDYTQLCWINNVLAIQEIIKAIRVLCPKIRYSFLDGEDLTKYKEDVQNMVINRYANRFQSCTIEYVSNALYDSNKILYAVIKVKFRNFVQTEQFKIIALQS